MKCSDQVLAVPGIDRGLAADRGVDLRQQGGRHLHVIEPAAHDSSGKPGEIADHAPAERHDQVAALDAGGDQRFTDSLEHGEALRALARRHRHATRRDSCGAKRRLGGGEIVARDRFVGDDGRLGTGTQGGNPLPERGEQAAADHDVIAALAEHDIDDDRVDRAQWSSHGAGSPLTHCAKGVTARPMCPATAPRISSTILSCGTSRDCTTRSARA